jgi:hypothetical protein
MLDIKAKEIVGKHDIKTLQKSKLNKLPPLAGHEFDNMTPKASMNAFDLAESLLPHHDDVSKTL